MSIINGVDGGIALLGLGGLALGAYHVRRRRVAVRDGLDNLVGFWTGPAAVLQGVSEMIAGLGIAAYGVLGLAGMRTAASADVRQRPGLVLTFASLGALAWAGALMTARPETGGSSEGWTVRTARRLIGSVVALVALAGLLLGVIDLIAPRIVDGWIADVRRAIPAL